jgi:hopanoid-associated phosphorylase
MSKPSEAGDVLAVVGMTREAKIIAGTRVAVGGGVAAALAERLEAELALGVVGVVSFGLCGALHPDLKVGDLVLGDTVVSNGDEFDADRAWLVRLQRALPDAVVGRFAWAERPVATPEERGALRARTAASAVDLESALVAQAAFAAKKPFAVVRAVSDAAGRVLPHAAQVGLGADGRPAVGAVLRSLRERPWQLPSLVRTALEAEDAFHALERARHLLGPRLAGPDLG